MSAIAPRAVGGEWADWRWKRIGGGTAFCLLSIGAAVLLARRLTSASWPLQDAGIMWVCLASVSYLASFGFRALGWQRVFPCAERPDCARCLAACGAAAASGAVLPFRLDYVIKVATLRRLRGVRLGLDTIVISILALGMVDAVAMLPLAVSAIATSGSVLRAPLVVVILFCLGCLTVLVAGPRLLRLPVVQRSERLTAFCRRLTTDAAITRSKLAAGGFLFGCWTSRAFGSACLLTALGAGFSPTMALVVLCMAGAASILPITAGGAVASMGATAGVLFALGVSRNVAINFALASGLLITLSALSAAAIGGGGSMLLARGVTLGRRRAPAALPAA
jgi:Lysylphosphatidylglycerol synthase TM region